MIVISNFELAQVAAPNLPLAPEEYNRAYIDQLNNVFRLYFNRIDSILGQLNANPLPNETQVAALPVGTIYYDTTAGNVLKIKV